MPSIDGVELSFTVKVVRSQGQQFTVTPSGDGKETFTPSTAQAVNAGATQSFNVTASSGYSLQTPGGTCAQGSFSGSTYTTGPITGNCTVMFTAHPAQQFTVTPSGDGKETFTPNTPQTVNAGSTQAFTVTPNSGGYVLSAVGGTCPTGSFSGSTYTTGPITANCTVLFTAILPETTLEVVNPETLPRALSVNCLPSSTTCPTLKNVALTGNSRTITIKNTGVNQAHLTNVTSNGLPVDTNITGDTCTNATLAPNGGTCTLTITPGEIASSNCTTGIAPTPGTISVNATNAGPVSAGVVVLSYGCIYQGGFLYSIKDTTANTGNIGGKALALADQIPRPPNGIVWDADPVCTQFPYDCTQQTGASDFYYGENVATIPGSTNPNNSGTNGPGDTYLIVSILSGHNGNTNNPANYAAAVCTTYNNGVYADWYLPALCEIGPASNGSGCISGTQNIVDNLVLLLGDPNNSPDTSCSYGRNCLAGLYWSSTEESGTPQSSAWYENFNSGGSFQFPAIKASPYGVRCSRALIL